MRRKGIARCAVLHLDCARFAKGSSYRFALEEHYYLASPINQDVLRISFTTHDVRIRGRSLRLLLNAVRKRSIDWINPLLRRYEKLVATDAGFVGKIDVEGLRDTAVS